MSKSVWESYNFEPKEEEIIKLPDYQLVISLIEEQIFKVIGLVKDLEVKTRDSRIVILAKHQHLFELLMRDENNFIIRQRWPDLEIIFPLEVFPKYFIQIINLEIIPILKKLYQQDYLTELPEILVDKTKIDLSLITSEWFETTFEEIAEEEGYFYKIEETEIKPLENGLEISFDVDCDRYGVHRGNTIIINQKGNIRFRLAEIIEGGDLEGELKKAIEKHLK